MFGSPFSGGAYGKRREALPEVQRSHAGSIGGTAKVLRGSAGSAAGQPRIAEGHAGRSVARSTRTRVGDAGADTERADGSERPLVVPVAADVAVAVEVTDSGAAVGA